MTFHVDAEVVIWCEDYRRSRTVAARFWDRKTERFYSGSGATALEAFAWCMHDFIARGLLGHEPSIAMRSDSQPGDGLTPASSRPRRCTPAPITHVVAIERDDPKAEIACFERTIRTSPAPRLFHETPPLAQPKPRARGTRR